MEDSLQLPQITVIAAPLVVAALCLYGHRRRIGGNYLVFWAAAHAGLSLLFGLLTQAPTRPDLDDLPPIWFLILSARMAWNWLLLIGVVELVTQRIGLGRGFLAAALLTLVSVAPIPFGSPFIVYGVLPASTLILVSAAAILLVRRRSLAYVVAGLVILIR